MLLLFNMLQKSCVQKSCVFREKFSFMVKEGLAFRYFLLPVTCNRTRCFNGFK